MAQLRTNCSSLVRATLYRFGRATSPLCRACGEYEVEDVEHLLCLCPAYLHIRSSLWGPLPTISDVLSGPAEKIVQFLVRAGRTSPPADEPGRAAP